MNSHLHFPWLELSIVCPLIASALCFRIQNQATAQRVALLACALTFALTLGEWFDFSTLGTFSAQDSSSLIQLIFGAEIFVIDELTAPLLSKVPILFGLTIAATMRSKAGRFSVGRTLQAQAIVLAILSCSSAAALIVLLALSTILPWQEMRSRGFDTRIFTVFMSFHLSLLLLGIILLWLGQRSPLLTNLAACLLVLSAMLRAGIFPGHSWIVDLFEKCTFGTALLFVAPMTGAYVVMRLVLPVVPVWALHGIAVLSLLTALYAAGMALVQIEARRFFAFLFISHSSLVLAGLEIANPIGMTGALCIWLEIGFSLGGLALTLRAVEARIGRISLDRYHGLFDHMPRLGTLFLITGLASIGFPRRTVVCRNGTAGRGDRRSLPSGRCDHRYGGSHQWRGAVASLFSHLHWDASRGHRVFGRSPDGTRGGDHFELADTGSRYMVRRGGAFTLSRRRSLVTYTPKVWHRSRCQFLNRVNGFPIA